MKLFTLNTHSLQEAESDRKLSQLAHFLSRERPDVIALQEVSQTRSALPAPPEMRQGYVPAAPGVILRQDNYGMHLAALLRAHGLESSWTWLPVKLGYDQYDEGLALLSLGRPIRRIDAFRISRSGDYRHWKTRKILGVRLAGADDWFYTVHMGWWDDAQEPFREQWRALERGVAAKMAVSPIWLMGDFNGPAEVRGESYDCIRDAGWSDAYCLAENKDDGLTVRGPIDGWRGKAAGPAAGMRIDQIWCSRKAEVQSARVVCNGENGPVVSDHYGILIELRRMKP